MSNLCINYIVGIIFEIEINLHRQKSGTNITVLLIHE